LSVRIGAVDPTVTSTEAAGLFVRIRHGHVGALGHQPIRIALVFERRVRRLTSAETGRGGPHLERAALRAFQQGNSTDCTKASIADLDAADRCRDDH